MTGTLARIAIAGRDRRRRRADRGRGASRMRAHRRRRLVLDDRPRFRRSPRSFAPRTAPARSPARIAARSAACSRPCCLAAARVVRTSTAPPRRRHCRSRRSAPTSRRRGRRSRHVRARQRGDVLGRRRHADRAPDRPAGRARDRRRHDRRLRRDADRSVHCWGNTSSVGDGSSATIVTPVEVAGIGDAVQLGANDEGACVRRANGHVACWGTRFTDWTARTAQIHLVAARNSRHHRRDRSAPRVARGLRAPPGRAATRAGASTARPRASARRIARKRASASWVACSTSTFCGCTRRQHPVRRDHAHRVRPNPANTTELWKGSWYRGEHLCARAGGEITCQAALGRRTARPTSARSRSLASTARTSSRCTCRSSRKSTSCARPIAVATSAARAWSIDRAVSISVEGVRALAEGPVLPFSGDAATCAVTKDAAVTCWSDGGNGGEPHACVIPGITDAVEVAGGSMVGCALRKTGHVACWGDGNLVGNGARATRDWPVAVRGVAL